MGIALEDEPAELLLDNDGTLAVQIDMLKKAVPGVDYLENHTENDLQVFFISRRGSEVLDIQQRILHLNNFIKK